MMSDDDGQMIFGDVGGLKLPDICLKGEAKPRKNLTQETCPDRGSNPGPLRDRRACWRLAHSGGRKLLRISIGIGRAFLSPGTIRNGERSGTFSGTTWLYYLAYLFLSKIILLVLLTFIFQHFLCLTAPLMFPMLYLIVIRTKAHLSKLSLFSNFDTVSIIECSNGCQ